MRVARFARFGPPEVITIDDLPPPRLRHADDVRVRVHASSANPKDVLLRRGKFGALTRWLLPLPLGSDFAGIVEEAGPRSDLRPGDAVWGMLGPTRFGGCGELLVAGTDEVGRAPATLPLLEAAALPLVALTSLQALRDLGRVVPGDRVLVHGASGGVGTAAVQLAKALGAVVTAVCSARNHELVRGLGADATVDYRVTPPEDLSERFDVFFDVFGDKPFELARRVLTPQGVHITTVPSPRAFADAWRTRRSRQRSRVVLVRPSRRDLDALARLVDAGSLRPVIDRVFALEDLSAAHAYLETKRARGKVVIAVDAPQPTSTST